MKKILLTLLAVIAFGAVPFSASAIDLALEEISIKKRQPAYYVNTDYEFEATVKNYSSQVIPAGSYYIKIVDQNNNEGTAAAEAYTVELLDCTDTANPKVLAKADVTTAIAPAASATQELKYTFETSGEYKLAARVTTEGDAKAENNTTAPVTFKVDKYNGIDGVVAEGTLSFEGKVLRVNVGEGVVAVVDLAGRVVARYEVKGAEEIRLDLAAGIYVVTVNGRTLKIRI